MGLVENVGQDLIAAMKSGDSLRLSVIRLLRTRLKETQVEKRRELEDEECLKVVMSEVAKRKEAIELFDKGGRADLAGRELKEIEILETYLPPKLSEEELRTIVSEAVKESGARVPGDLGKVMKVVMPKVTGRAEGSLVNRIVRELLAEAKD
ncbi:MAG: GatB/YqeY domain-containing protein [bacterium]